MTPKCPDCKRDQEDCICFCSEQQKQVIERQAAQIEMMRQSIQALENDSEECLDFDECTSVLVPIDTFHALIDAMVLSPDQALEQFAAKVREQCAGMCQSVIASGAYDGNQQYAAASCRDAIRAIKELP